MNKLFKLIKGATLLLRKPSLINLIIESDDRWKEDLQKKHPTKLQLPTISIEDLIPDFNETLSSFSFLGGGSLPTDILLLKALCKEKTNCSYFEIGTWRGESVLNVSEEAKECYTLNLSKQDIIDVGMPKKYAELHGFFSKEKSKITHLFGNSLAYDFKKLNKKFDVIFIDGNHKYDFVKNDTQQVFKHLVHNDSIVVWHDYAYDPETVRPEVLVGILDGIPKEFKENVYHVSNSLCAIFTRKKIVNSLLDFPIKPEKTFKVNIKINKSIL